MQTNDFVKINYSGKVKETGIEFDKGENVPMIVGVNFTLKGIDNALLVMSIGEKKTIAIEPKDAFGDRDVRFVKLVPLSEFTKHDTKPYPGMIVQADNAQGRVLSVSGGRVRVDFNHPLSGKTLVYDLEVKEKIDKDEEKIKAIIKMYTRTEEEKSKPFIIGKEVEIEVPPMINSVYKKKIADDVMKILGFEKVRFIEVFEKQKEVKEK